jgi:cytoskeletal protein CcmA (bactofilin family)
VAIFGKTRHTPAIKLTQISSLVAEGVEIDGDLSFHGGLRIDGCLRGQLRGRSGDGEAPALLVLSQTGRVEGSVRCGHALINGQVLGDLEVEHFVELQAGARISGTLRYRQLQMDVGAVVQGQLIHLDEAAPAAAAPLVALVTEPRAAGEPR